MSPRRDQPAGGAAPGAGSGPERNESGRERAARRGLTVGALVVLAAIVLSLVGLLVDPRRAAFSYLAAWATVLGIALGALSLLMIAHVTGAHWFQPLVPFARATAGTLPLLAVLFLPIVAGLHVLYPWVPPLPPLDPAVRAHVLAKAAYLNVPFFLVRAAAYFVVWIGLTELLLRGSPAARRLWSAVGLPPFAFATTFAAIDWVMSLLPAWWSTIFGLYFWSGGFLAALACVAVLAAASRATGAPADPSDRSNTLGKLVLTFLLFWAYVGFCQFLVIWIGDVPLEASWLAPRLAGSWAGISALVLVGQFALPFALLLPRRNRARPAVLGAIGAWVLLMHWVDVYWLVLPALTPGGFRPHWLDLTNLLAVAGLTLAFGAWRLRRLAPELLPEAVEVPAWW